MVHLLLAVIYLAFISLGLPDSLLGSAWPLMYPQLGVDISWAGIVSVIISCGTVVSSLLSDRVTRKFGTGLVTFVSVAMTAGALLGFSVSTRFWMLCLFAVPYGLGAGSIDAALNNYVAVHYASRHMSWLHCMWGIGASIGPNIMAFCLSGSGGWPAGYQIIGLLQLVLAGCMLLSLPLWHKTAADRTEQTQQPLSLKEIFRIPGARAVILAFFCYCAAEASVFLWASSYMVLHRGIPEEMAAIYVGIFYLGMTAGRALNGFLTIGFSDRKLIGIGSCIILIGILVLMIPGNQAITCIAFALIGLGFAPIYPSIIHSTPELFGQERSQAIIGVEMAGAYLGSLLMPPVFGLIANHVHMGLFPFFLLVFILLMIRSYRTMCKQTA